ncbi:MAG: PA14 domain-containing protein, partial [Chitinophagaceae bacterium]
MKTKFANILAIIGCLGLACATSPVFSQAGSEHLTAIFPKYTRTKLYSWSDPFESYKYQETNGYTGYDMAFRLLLPNGFVYNNNAGKKYPIIIFFHGRGEAAVSNPLLQDNEKQLLHGAQTSMTAVQNNSFPGILLYPQVRESPDPCGGQGQTSCDGGWLDPPKRLAVLAIVDRLIKFCDVDPDRIYVSGLSGGGKATWQVMANYPEYFAAGRIFSAAGPEFWAGTSGNNQMVGSPSNGNFTVGSIGAFDMAYYKHIPVQTSQGGRDAAPPPSDGNTQSLTFRTTRNGQTIGGNIIYNYYPTLGHNTWNAEYAKSDYFTWLLTKKKTMIWVENQQTSFCPGQSISVKLGTTGNPNKTNTISTISGYEWQLSIDGGLIYNTISLSQTTYPTIPTNNEIIVTTAGMYRMRIYRPNLPSPLTGWSAWSDPVTIDNLRGPSTTPVISTQGKSTNLPSLDGSPDVALYGPASKASYLWSPGSITTQNYTVSTAGTYSLQTTDPAGSDFATDGITTAQNRPAAQGCTSLPSNVICVSTQNDLLNSPAPPNNFFGSAASPTSIKISFDDRSANEDSFELYRSTTAGSGYVLVSLIPATNSATNPQVYTDLNLQANTTYYYRMRSVNCFGSSAYTSEIAVSTAGDTSAPTSPVLTVGSTSRTIINLSWSGSTDNIAVYQYDVYQNGILIATINHPTTTFAATGLTAFATYNYVVKARDLAGNVSPPSNQVTPAAVNTGLFYSYYTSTSALTSVSQIISNSTFVKSGTINNFLLTPASPRTTNYAFIFDGFINIPTTGNYTFFTSSDDGSQLFINNVLNVNNDGVHGATERSGTVLNLSAGTYPIKVTYFQGGGGLSLSVKWQGPGIAKQSIPDNVLKDTYTPPVALTAPTGFTVNTPVPTYNTINLKWVDNSNNETGFELSRAATATSTAPAASAYQVVVVAPAGAGTGTTQTLTDANLTPNTFYWYKIRAINATSASSLVTLPSPFYIKTAVAPSVPTVPTGLSATPISATQVNLAWTASTNNPTGYELQRSSNSTTGFVTIATINAPTVAYSDLTLNGHSTVYYQIRALGAGGTSSVYSTPSVQAITPNRAPDAFDIVGQTITSLQASPVQTITTTVTDPDSDPITFLITGLPSGATYTDNGYGKLVFSFVSIATNTTGYTINVQASDGISTVSDTFILKATTNRSPVASIITTTGSIVTSAVSTIGNQTTEEGRTLVMTFTVTDPDGNAQLELIPLVNSLPPYVTISNLPAFITPTWSGTGSSARVFTLTMKPLVNNAGIYNNITIAFKDNAGGINVQTFSLTVAALDPYFTLSVNFTQLASNTESSPWNNTSLGAPANAALPNLKDDQGNNLRFVTFNPMAVAPASGWNTTASYPALPSSTTPIYTKKVRESFYTKNSSTVPTKFQNLNPSMLYNVTIFGAFPEASGTRLTRYTVTGLGTPQNPLDLNTVNNTSNTVSLPSPIYPATNGDLTILVGRGTSNTGSYYINSIVLTAIKDTGLPPNAPSNLLLDAPLYNRVNISWQDNSNDETAFDIFRSTSVGGPFNPLVTNLPANQTAYTDATVTGRTTYYYYVLARNSYGPSAPTSTVLITTPNGAPVIANPGTVTVRAGQVLQTNISATDPEGDAVSFSILNLPAFATFVDNGNNTGFIRFSPLQANVGSYTLTIRATDAFTASSQLDFNLLVLDPVIDEAVYINFVSTASSNAGAPWNNLIVNTNAVTLNNSNGVVSGFGAGSWTLSSGVWNSSSDNLGVNTGSNSGIYPDKVNQSFWSTNSTTGVTITLANLDNSKKYNIDMIGSRNEYWFADAIYTINGVSKTLNTSKNSKNIVHFSGLQPSSGVITINVKKPVDIAAGPPIIGHRDAPLNAMVIEAYTPVAKPRRPTNLVAKGISKTAVKLTWFDNSSNETGFEIYRATSQSGPFTPVTTVAPNTESYTDAGSQNTAYIYRVRAAASSTPSDYSNDAITTTLNQIVYLNINSTSGAGFMQVPSSYVPRWNNLAKPSETGASINNL